MTDRSNGYERVSKEFLAGRGRAPSTAVGAREVRDWARTLPRGATVLDLGCGSGLPITKQLVDEGLSVFAIDASPSMVQAFRKNFPEIPIACEAVEESTFFGRTFDAVVSWGLIFLLAEQDQRHVIQRIASVLGPGGRLLFTTCGADGPVTWTDVMTGLESRSIGREEYRRELSAAGLVVVGEYDDEGENHYFDARKS
ncbi:MAG TPA: class I SAM-dependent methyltransferase [Gemmatimonadaceae bacterium]|jgi:SAM-dependent methyltransferase